MAWFHFLVVLADEKNGRCSYRAVFTFNQNQLLVRNLNQSYDCTECITVIRIT